MNFRDYITIQQDVLGGKPVIKGTRIPVDLIVAETGGGMPVEQLMNEYELTREQILAAFQYAAEVLREEVVFP